MTGARENPDRVRIVVVAAASHPDVLSVQDAMRQVLDFFELLTPENDDGFIWNLKLASTNSPLTVEGEPYHTQPEVNAKMVAAAQRILIDDSFKSLSQGRKLGREISAKKRDVIKRVLQRNMNGIGKTEAVLVNDEKPILVTPAIAEVSVRALVQTEDNGFASLVLRDRARSEYGTLEGIILDVGSDYNRPAVLVKERKTNQEIWCRVSADVRGRISSETTLNDVWANSRVFVRGRIRYASDGSFVRVWAHDLRLLKPKSVSLDDIADPDFTLDLSTSEYLEKLLGGNLG